MGQIAEVYSGPLTQRSTSLPALPISSSPSTTGHAHSFTLSQLLGNYVPKAPQITPLGSPMTSSILSIEEGEDYLIIKPNPQQDDWLPITASRNGNAYYATFHTLNSGIGFQSLMLPFSFTILGWTWGITCLLLVFMWQLYTLWLLVQLHESPSGTRCSRYLQLVKTAFGERVGKLMALIPVMYLSGGTCVTMIIMAGGSIRAFIHVVCGPTSQVQPLTKIEWYLVFVCVAILIAQLPNLNSIAWVSLIGAITAVVYCTMIWVISVSKSRAMDVSYDPLKANSNIERAFRTMNALGIIAFAFRGHNLVLEIQGTMPSSDKRPSHVPMWRGVKQAYVLISMCFFPLAIGGYWAYGDKIPADGGVLSALHKFHGQDTSRTVLGLTSMIIIINYLCSFQIYAMPVFDNLELAYTSRKKKPCPWWVRSGFRAFFGCLTLFVAVAIPFLPSLAGLIGGIALPVTLAYPCFMWNVMNKQQGRSVMWWFNWVLGSLGIVLSVLVVAGAIWGIKVNGIDLRSFKP